MGRLREHPLKADKAKRSRLCWINANSIVKLSNEQSNGQTLRRFSLTAYTGVDMVLDGLDYRCVFDLSTVQKAPTIPLLFNHIDSEIVGHTDNVIVTQANVTASGVISGTGSRAKEIIANTQNGFTYQVSIGLLAGYLDFYKANETVTVNGRTFNGPIYVARNGLIRELSFCSMGADCNTNAILVASLKGQGVVIMTFEEWVIAKGLDPASLTDEQKSVLMVVYEAETKSSDDNTNAVAEAVSFEQWVKDQGLDFATLTDEQKAELTQQYKTEYPDTDASANMNANAAVRTTQVLNANSTILNIRRAAVNETRRIDRIKVLAASYGNPRDKSGNYIANTAMSNGWTVERTELEMLRAARPNNVVLGSGNDNQNWFRILEAALAQSGKLSNLEKKFDPRILDAAHKKFKSRLGLQECLLEAAYSNGYTGGRNFKADLGNILRAAFSSIEVPGILSNTANKFLMAGFESVDETWRLLSKITSVSDFKETYTYRGVGSFRFEKLPPDGLIPHARMSEAAYGNRAETHAKMIAITRVDIINDDLGALTDVPRGLGRGGALQLNFVFWTEFLDNSAFFASGNDNTSSGALGLAGLTNIFTKFRKLKDEDGNFVLGTPKYLLVPVELEPEALRWKNSTQIVVAGTASAVTTVAVDNPHAGKFEVVTSPYLSDTAFSGSSTTAYYLIADPQDVPVIEVAFLDGVETPTVETADVDFNRLGIQMRGFFDFGVRKQEPRGGVRSTGA